MATQEEKKQALAQMIQDDDEKDAKQFKDAQEFYTNPNIVTGTFHSFGEEGDKDHMKKLNIFSDALDWEQAKTAVRFIFDLKVYNWVAYTSPPDFLVNQEDVLFLDPAKVAKMNEPEEGAEEVKKEEEEKPETKEEEVSVAPVDVPVTEEPKEEIHEILTKGQLTTATISPAVKEEGHCDTREMLTLPANKEETQATQPMEEEGDAKRQKTGEEAQ